MKFKVFIRSIFLVCSLLATGLNAQKPTERLPQEIIPVREKKAETARENGRFDAVTGHLIALYNIEAAVTPASPEAMALEYLTKNAAIFGLSAQTVRSELKHHATRNGLSGWVVRFDQYHNKIPVFQGEIVLHINKKHMVTYVANNFIYGLQEAFSAPRLSEEAALNLAFEQIKLSGKVRFQKQTMTLLPLQGEAYLCYRVQVQAEAPGGEWDVFVDAQTGKIWWAENKAQHQHDPLNDANGWHAPMAAPMSAASGNVFLPDPISSSGSDYNTGGFVDNNDANSTDLTGELVSVMLPDVVPDGGGTYHLSGTFASIVDSETPNNGLFAQNSPSFNFNRQDDAYEAVNCYYHIDASMRYVNLTLGLGIMPFQYAGGVRYDPHGLNGDDNSHYLGGSGELAFGEGGVDDAEDASVIIHELGHGLHDWVTAGNLSQVDGLSEGCGDYWAASYLRAFNSWAPTDPEYNWVFVWDGHNPFWGGRTVDYRPATPAYPGGLVSDIHTDGQIWATCMMDVFNAIGKPLTDVIFWEGLGMTNSTASQQDAAAAVMQAAQNLSYDMVDLIEIRNALSDCGYALPTLPCVNSLTLDASKPGVLTSDIVFSTANDISATNTVASGSVVAYHAGQSVKLSPGFRAMPGSKFRAYIQPCTDGSLIPPDSPISSEERSLVTGIEPGAIIAASPNPFGSTTTVTIILDKPGRYSVAVFDLNGRQIETLAEHSDLETGAHHFQWGQKEKPQAGIYFVKAQSESGVLLTQKVVVQ